MKKSALISLIVAAALIVTGGMLAFAGLRSIDLDYFTKPAERTYIVEEAFDSITVDTGTCDVHFAKTDGTLRVVCPETEKLDYIVIVEEGVLRISAMDMRKWYDFIDIGFGEMEMTVYLPESQYQSLIIETDTGDIEIPQDFSFDTAELITSTGDIDFAAAVTENLITKNSTGDTEIYGVNPTSLESRSSTGAIELENIQVVGDIRLTASTGTISAEKVTCKNLTTKSNTGNTELENVLVEESLQITTTTGDVEIEHCDAATVNINTDTGDVTGNFLSPKWFITETDTGDIRVPLSREGGECRITTDTGDIVFF